MAKVRTKGNAPLVYEMDLVATPEHKICAVDVVCCNLAPCLVRQMPGVDTNHIPSLAFADFVHQIAAGLACSSNSFMTVSKSRNTEFTELENLEMLDISTGYKN